MNCENIDSFITNALTDYQQYSTTLANVNLENMVIPRMAETIRTEMIKRGIKVVVPEISRADPITQVDFIARLIKNIYNATPFVEAPFLKSFAEYLSNGVVYSMHGHGPVLETVTNLKYFAAVTDEISFRISKDDNTPVNSWSYMFTITENNIEFFYRQVKILDITKPTGYRGGQKNSVCIVFSRTPQTTTRLDILIIVNGNTIFSGSAINENTPTSIINTTFYGLKLGWDNSPYTGAFVGIKVDSPQFEYKEATAKLITAYADYIFSSPI